MLHCWKSHATAQLILILIVHILDELSNHHCIYLQYKQILLKNRKKVWSGNTTITNCRQTHETARKSLTSITRYQEDKLSKAASSLSLFPIKIAKLEWTHKIYNKWAATWDFQHCGMYDQQGIRQACAYAQSDQNLCLSLEYSMSVKLLTEQHLKFQSLKGGCTGSSESTLVKIPHWWKSRVVAQINNSYNRTTVLERTAAYGTKGLKCILLV